jgi:nitrous oxidase accessory protein
VLFLAAALVQMTASSQNAASAPDEHAMKLPAPPPAVPVVSAAPRLKRPGPAATLRVGAGAAHSTIQAALAAAADGDTIIVGEGRYAEGTLLVNKSVALIGEHRPVLDGGFKHEVITITAPDVTVRGFAIVNGGRSSTRELSGIRVEGVAGYILADNKLTACDYGIYLAGAGQGEVTGNILEGKSDEEMNSGNGIHLWNSKEARITGNHVSGHRDGIYLEFANNTVIEGNEVTANMRYGLHFMNAHGSRYHKNRFVSNGAGVAIMYSREVQMTDNVFEMSWGSAAYGLLIKDVVDSSILRNVIRKNSTGIYAQGATRCVFERNEFRENGWALRVLSNGLDNTFRANVFSRNSFDVGTNGDLANHAFTGNYWDRYEGYDLKRDGAGDVPFRPVSLYAIITERVPASLFLMHSLMVQVLDRAEKAFPSITPDSVVDSAPAMRPPPPL